MLEVADRSAEHDGSPPSAPGAGNGQIALNAINR